MQESGPATPTPSVVPALNPAPNPVVNTVQDPAPAPGSEAIIRAEKVEKYYAQPSQNRIQVISATDLSVLPGEILALLGPSGSGKSTMLRMLSGLSTPTAGQVYWHEKPIADATTSVSIVFQSFALFPWLTVLENVEAPLQARGVDPDERRARSMKMLDTVGLDGFEAAYPKELSGGMKQRVGFARALVVEPEVLFMDEPFSALDVLTAENLRSELLELWANKTMPTKAVFLVTHNIEEAVLLADRIVVLGRNPGHIRTDFRVQLAQPRDRKSEAFTQLVDYIYKVLTRPDVAPAQAPDQQAGPKIRDQRQMHYQMLPHARPGGVAGLLELLLDKGGRDDIYRLAEDLAFEIDDLLPIVDAAQLLGFLKIEEGDAAITPTGTEFANSEILRQKELFRDAAVTNVLLLRQIQRALQAKSDHTVSEDFFLDMLDEQFSEDESLRQIETAVAWGRYAELFDFDSGRRRFFLPDASDEEVAPAGPGDNKSSEAGN
jgi:NitT/TauT family transport system ATP-binding protein